MSAGPALPCGGFGKLPTQGDFIRAIPSGYELGELRALDAWVSAGLYEAGRVLSADFAERYDNQLFHRVIFRADNSGYTLAGVIRAAQDAVLRRFPFLCFAFLRTSAIDHEPRLVPALGDALFAPLEARLLAVAQLRHLAAIQTQLLQPLPLPALDDDHEDRYRVFLEEVEVADLCPGDPQCAVTLLQRLWTVLSGPQDPRMFTFSLVLPLSQPPFSRPLEQRFWLELIHLLVARAPTLSLFWRAGTAAPAPTGAEDRPEHAPARDSLLIAFRQPRGQLWTGLLRTERAAQGLWRPAQGEPPPAGFTYRLGARRTPVVTPEFPLGAVLSAFGRGGAALPERIG